MFYTIGRLTDRYRIPLLVFWIGAAVLITALAPALEDVAGDDQTGFLPENAQSMIDRELVLEQFPALSNGSSVTLVFDAGDGQQITAEENLAYITRVSEWLVSDDAPAGIESVQSPTLNPESAGALISQDGEIAIVPVMVGLLPEQQRNALLEEIEAEIHQDVPADLAVYTSGEVAIYHDYGTTITESADRTIWITLIMVVVILLAIYRSPVSPFIPLFVVTIAYLITRGIVGWLAEGGVFSITSTANTLLVVVMYGAGTDYCLFLISRFREELASNKDTREATRSTVKQVGESITSSAGTVITGFLAMATARLGLFNTTGPALAIGIVISLLAGLTLTPAILSLLGQWSFFPAKAAHRDTGTLYKRTSQFASSRPLLTILIIVAIMTPFAVYGSQVAVNYDSLADMPEETNSVAGFRVLEEHLGAGELQPLTAVSMLNQETLLADTDALTAELSAVEGVAAVRSATQPLGAAHQGTAGMTRLPNQLAALGGMLSNPAVDVTPEEMQIGLAMLADMPAYLELIGTYAPELADNEHYAAAVEAGGTVGVAEPLLALSQDAPPVHVPLSELPAGIYTVFGGDAMAGLIGSYLNPETGAARFEIVLEDNPFSLPAMDTVLRLRDMLKTVPGEDGISGTTATNTDLRDLQAKDMRQTIAFVLIGIFLVLLVMLRSIVAPMYLIGTILLSYGTTIGITRLASEAFWGTDKLTWWVPFFMFVFLVALGIDYSIFLFGRIKEEVTVRGAREGIHHAVAATGSIITSAGVIVAATFAGLMAGDILGLSQIGFAVSLGILIDTFVVRTILDPALATFFGKWTWWPGGLVAHHEGRESTRNEALSASSAAD